MHCCTNFQMTYVRYSSSMNTRRIEILRLSDRVLVNPSSQVPAGFWVSHGPWLKLSLDATANELADTAILALSNSRVGIAEPEDYKQLRKECFSAAGVRSERAYLKGALLVSIRQDGSGYKVTPYLNGGVSGSAKGFSPLEHKAIKLIADTQPEEIGAAILTAFSHCVPQSNSDVEH